MGWSPDLCHLNCLHEEVPIGVRRVINWQLKGVKTSLSLSSLCLLCLEGQWGQGQQTEGPTSHAVKGARFVFQ